MQFEMIILVEMCQALLQPLYRLLILVQTLSPPNNHRRHFFQFPARYSISFKGSNLTHLLHQ
jgi:hypothetical protein